MEPLPPDPETLRARLAKRPDGHKFTHGHALVLAGPPGRGGAARLAARGALRVGAGLVTLGAPAAAMPEHAARLDAVMLREIGDGAALAAALADRRITALCLGPGLGLDARAAGLVAAALAAGIEGGTQEGDAPASPSLPHAGGEGRPVSAGADGAGGAPSVPVGERGAPGAGRRAAVLDADALTLLARDRALFARLHAACVLTPHAGEFARLFPDLAAGLEAPAAPAAVRAAAAGAAAARAGCTVVLKGPETVIADASGRCAVHSAAQIPAAAWLATAGSGDVLAGFVAGLLARGLPPFEAAGTAVWLHVACARAAGPGLIAEDLPEALPGVLRALGL